MKDIKEIYNDYLGKRINKVIHGNNITGIVCGYEDEKKRMPFLIIKLDENCEDFGWYYDGSGSTFINEEYINDKFSYSYMSSYCIENFLNTAETKKYTEKELRDNYNLYIVINPEFSLKDVRFYYQIFNYTPNDEHGDYLNELYKDNLCDFETYEQALNDALIKANEFIKKYY